VSPSLTVVGFAGLTADVMVKDFKKETHQLHQTETVKTALFVAALYNRNSSVDEIANVNVFYDDIVHVEASAYAH